MAKILTPIDAHTLINVIAKNLTGQSELTAFDATSFVSVGETLLSNYPKENIINQLAILIGKTIVKSRPYKDKLSLITENDGNIFNNRVRKISFYSKDALESGWYNTQLKTNFADGYDNGTNGGNSTQSQWVQNQPETITEYFGGIATWQDCLTRYESKLEQAFTDEESFIAFINGIITEKMNDMETEKESANRAGILNHIAMVQNMSNVMQGSYVDLVALYNQENGTALTGTDLRTTYLKEFLEFFIAQFKIVSDQMTYRTALYHNPATMTKGSDTYNILRHTPKEDQRAFLYAPFFTKAEAKVMPEIFNENYLKRPNAELVSFWQNPKAPASINVKGTYLNTVTGEQVTAENATEIPYLLGMIFDKDAIKSHFSLETVRSTNTEARKGYINTWYTYSKQIASSSLENCVVFYMAS